MADPPIPDPAVVVMVGAAGAGKSHWAAQHYREVEIVSSDHLRSVVGSGPADLDATEDAFDLLDRVVTARAGRRLTTVVDTLGLDNERRRDLLRLARDNDLTAAVVVVDTPASVCRDRNAERDRPVPASALRSQLRRVREVEAELADEGWDLVLTVRGHATSGTDGSDHGAPPVAAAPTTRRGSQDPLDHGQPGQGDPGQGQGPGSRLRGVVLQVSRFPWGEDPLAWVVEVARAAEDAGFAGLALMDHLVQIPQVGRAWEPIPEPLVTLGAVAASTNRLMLGTLVSPVTLRAPGVLAKSMATLDVLSGGRAFCGVGAGWYAREHAGHHVPFPPVGQRQDALERGIEVMRALWAPGTKAFEGDLVQLPETTSYPRPVGDIPVVVGGSGARTLGIAARRGDACNVRTAVLEQALPVLQAHCDAAGRRVGEDVAVTVLDVAVVGTHREDLARRVERLRGGTDAATFMASDLVGTVAQHRRRYVDLAATGVSTVFLAPPDLDDPSDVHRLAPLADALG